MSASLTSLLLGFSSLVAGARAIKEGLNGLSDDLGAVTNRGRVRGGSSRASMLMDEGGDNTGRGMILHKQEVTKIEDNAKAIVGLIRKGSEDPRIRQLTAKVLSRKCSGSKGMGEWCVPEKDYDAEISAIYNFARRRVRYTRDIDNLDTYQSAARTLQMGIGDCDCYTIVVGSMLRSVGYPVRIRIVQTSKSASWDHIYLLVGTPPRKPEKWVSMDASLEAHAGWEVPQRFIAKKKDFPV
jgi:hypothetical protein